MARRRRRNSSSSGDRNTKKLAREEMLLVRFQNAEHTKPSLSNSDLLTFLSEANAITLSRIGMGLNLAQIQEDCYRLWQYLREHYSERTRLWAQIQENWPQDPIVFRLAYEFQDELDKKSCHIHLNARQVENVSALVQYIVHLKIPYSVSYTDSTGDILECSFDGTEDAEDLGDELRDRLTLLARRDGFLFLRYDVPGTGRTVCNGFAFCEGEVLKLPRSRLRELLSEDADMDLQQAFITFDYGKPLSSGPKPWTIQDTEAATNRIWSLEKQKGPSGSLLPGEMVNFIRSQNSVTALRLAQGYDLDSIGADCAQFSTYFLLYYAGNAPVVNAVKRKWPRVPLVFLLGDQHMDRQDRELEDVPLSAAQRENISRITNYIAGIDADRMLTMVYGSRGTSEVLEVPLAGFRENEPFYREKIQKLLTRMVKMDGTLTFRFASDPPGFSTINMFTVSDGQVRKASAEEIQWAMETQPDGSRKSFPNEQYQEAFVQLL